MIIAVIALVVALTGALGVVVWLVRTALADRSRTADVLFDLVTAQSDLERSQFELEVTNKALRSANERADILEKELSRAIESDLGDGLADDDVTGRVLRLARKWAASTRADREVPAGGDGPVLDPEAAGPPNAGP